MGLSEGVGRSWGTLSPKPPGIYRFGLLQQRRTTGRATLPVWGKIARRFSLLLSAGSGRRSGRIPALPYPPPEQGAPGGWEGARGFPFPLPWGSLGWETGKGGADAPDTRGKRSW